MGEELNKVFAEIERRKKRLQALVEIAEQSLLLESEKREAPKPQTGFSSTYLWTSLAWVVGGIVILYYIRSRYGGSLGGAPSALPITVYLIIALGLGAVAVYYINSRKKEEVEVFDPGERGRAAKRLIKEFYGPLEEGLRNNDLRGLTSLADRLLEDPLLGKAMEVAKEGDPKLSAYALYLYVSFVSGNVPPEEIEEAIEKVDNRPLRLLLSSLLSRDNVS